MTSSLPTLGRFCARAIRQTPMISSRHLSSCAGLRLPMSRTLPALNPLQYKVLSVPTRAMSGKADSDLAEFLVEEIAAEKSNLKPSVDIPGFEIKKEGAELTLTKKHGAETIIVTLNVNHTVDSIEPDDGSQEAPEMKSKPNFEVDIVKGNGKTLSFSCSYIDAEAMNEAEGGGQEQIDDAFAIDEVTMFEGEDWSDKKYAVAGDILDGYLYDLFMNMLEDRGINKDFADQVSNFCSAYEHTQYINMLEDLQKFIK